MKFLTGFSPIGNSLYLAAMSRLAKILFNKSLDECSVKELQAITQNYPYFNAGHLLAVQKLQKEDPDQLSRSLQKANLHFRSLYITQVVSEKGNAEIIPGLASTPVKENTDLKNEESYQAGNEQPDHIPETKTQNELKEKIIADLPTEDLVPHENQILDSRAKLDNEDQSITTDELEQPTIEPFTSPENQHTEFDTIQSSHNDELIVPNDRAVVNQQEGSSDQQQSTSIRQPEPSNQQLSFEPYHTVDYFASQGIKVKLDENPTDKFSKQLKSFTEWLKTLKKVPDAEILSQAPVPGEQKVEQLAQTSLTETEVETEAMAEVWAKQGDHEKAIEIYRKLSLLEPSKSTYFASLIEDLKKASL